MFVHVQYFQVCSWCVFEFLRFMIVYVCLVDLTDCYLMFSRFIIGREKPGEQSEVAQLIQQTLEQERWQREMMEQRYKQYMDDDEEVRGSTNTHTQNTLRQNVFVH